MPPTKTYVCLARQRVGICRLLLCALPLQVYHRLFRPGICMCMHMCVYVCMYVCLCTSTTSLPQAVPTWDMYVYAYVHVCVCMCLCMSVCARTYIYIYTYCLTSAVRLHIYILPHTCIHTYILPYFSNSRPLQQTGKAAEPALKAEFKMLKTTHIHIHINSYMHTYIHIVFPQQFYYDAAKRQSPHQRSNLKC